MAKTDIPSQANYDQDVSNLKQLTQRLYSSARYKALSSEDQSKIKGRYYDKVLSPLINKYPNRLGKLDKNRFMGVPEAKTSSAPDQVKDDRIQSAAYALSGSFIDLARGTTGLFRNTLQTLGAAPHTTAVLDSFRDRLDLLHTQNQALQDSVSEHNISRHIGEFAGFAVTAAAVENKFPEAVTAIQGAMRSAGIGALTDIMYGGTPGSALVTGAEFGSGDYALGAVSRVIKAALQHGPKGEVLDPLINEAFKDAVSKGKPGKATIIIDPETKRVTPNRSLLPDGYDTKGLPPVPNPSRIGGGGDPTRKLLETDHVANYNFTEQEINNFKQVIEVNGGEFHGVDSFFGVYYHALYPNGTKTTLTRPPHEITPELVKRSIAEKKAIFLLQKNRLAPADAILHASMLPSKEAMIEYIHRYSMTKFKRPFDTLGAIQQQHIASHLMDIAKQMHLAGDANASPELVENVILGERKRIAELSQQAGKINKAVDEFTLAKTRKTADKLLAEQLTADAHKRAEGKDPKFSQWLSKVKANLKYIKSTTPGIQIIEDPVTGKQNTYDPNDPYENELSARYHTGLFNTKEEAAKSLQEQRPKLPNEYSLEDVMRIQKLFEQEFPGTPRQMGTNPRASEIMYHGTSWENAELIKSEGLKIGKTVSETTKKLKGIDKSSGIFLSAEKDVASDYPYSHGRKAIIHVGTGRLELEADPDYATHSSKAKYSKKDITRARIRKIEFLDEQGKVSHIWEPN